MNTPNKPLAITLWAVLAVAALVIWLNGELDAKVAVLLIAFVPMGIPMLLPRAYDALCLGVFMMLGMPVLGLLSGEVPELRGRWAPPVMHRQDEPGFWIVLVAWTAVSIAVIAFGVLRAREHRRARQKEVADGSNPFNW